MRTVQGLFWVGVILLLGSSTTANAETKPAAKHATPAVPAASSSRASTAVETPDPSLPYCNPATFEGFDNTSEKLGKEKSGVKAWIDPDKNKEKPLSAKKIKENDEEVQSRVHGFKVGTVELVGMAVGKSQASTTEAIAKACATKSSQDLAKSHYCTFYLNAGKNADVNNAYVNRPLYNPNPDVDFVKLVEDQPEYLTTKAELRKKDKNAQPDSALVHKLLMEYFKEPIPASKAKAYQAYQKELAGVRQQFADISSLIGTKPEMTGGVPNMLWCMENFHYVGMGCNDQQHRGPTVFGILLVKSGCTAEQAFQIVHDKWGDNTVEKPRMEILQAAAQARDTTQEKALQKFFLPPAPPPIRSMYDIKPK